jgi:hypothetical protein
VARVAGRHVGHAGSGAPARASAEMGALPPVHLRRLDARLPMLDWGHRYPGASLPTAPCPPPPPVDAAPAHPALADGRTLRLDSALQLLRQAGQAGTVGRARAARLAAGADRPLVDLSSRDALTGLANRRSFELALAREVDRVARSRRTGAAADAGHRPLQARQRHPRPCVPATWCSGRGQALTTACGRWTWWRASAARSSRSSCPTARPFGATVAERVRRRVERTPVAGRAQQIDVTSASAAPLRRSGCAPPRRCGSSAPTSSSTAPRRRAATGAAWSPVPCRWSATRNGMLLFDTFQFEDHE